MMKTLHQRVLYMIINLKQLERIKTELKKEFMSKTRLIGPSRD
jgi:hypothetical protein